mgnify:CR=1 FL=1
MNFKKNILKSVMIKTILILFFTVFGFGQSLEFTHPDSVFVYTEEFASNHLVHFTDDTTFNSSSFSFEFSGEDTSWLNVSENVYGANGVFWINFYGTPDDVNFNDTLFTLSVTNDVTGESDTLDFSVNIIFVNDQPHGLPLDHVSTLQNSFKFWENAGLESSNDGKKIIIKFVITSSKQDATAWVTWIVRDIGEGVLGHASVGPGIVEVALGDYGCDGGFQLFTVDTVETIMTHELGHSLGLGHSNNPDNIMYPTMQEVNYSYCLLN